MDPKGKVALVTGGARIGQVVAHGLAARGCDLALVYRGSRDAADATAAAARAAGVKAAVLRADATNETEIISGGERNSEVARTSRHSDQYGFDISKDAQSERRGVVCQPGHKREERIPVFDSCGADHETRRRWANNKLLGLAAGDRPSTLQRLHSILLSKAPVVALTQTLALEFAPEILVNAIAPGPILEPPGLTPEENMEVIEATPLRRWGGAAEIAKTILFLVDSDFITGECIRVDGGRHLF